MKTIKEQVAVMLAADEGKTIGWTSRFSDDSGKRIENTKNFDWQSYDYEIVEEPWEGWVNIYIYNSEFTDNGVIGPYKTKIDAENDCGKEGRTIKVREVIE